MKSINLKKALAAHRAAVNALSQVRFYKQAGLTERFSDQYEFAKGQYAEAQNALRGELTGISEVIDAAQGKAKERLLDAALVVELLDRLESELGLSRKAMEGVSVTVDPNAQDFPRAYKWTPMSTIFEATYKRGAWVLTDVRRDDCRRASRRFVVTHTEASKAALIDRFTAFTC